MRRAKVYLVPPGNYRSFRTTDGLAISQWCNQVGHFAHAYPGNLPPQKAPLYYQNHQHIYIHPGPSQHPQPSNTPHRTPNTPNQYSQQPSYRSHVNRHDTMGYFYPRGATYTNLSRQQPFSYADQTNNKYLLKDLTFQAKTPTIVTSFKIMLYRTNSALYQALRITNLSQFW